MELDIVVVTGSAVGGVDQPLHVGRPLIASNMHPFGFYLVNNGCPDSAQTRGLVEQALAGDQESLRKLTRGRSACQTGCRHGEPTPTSPYSAIVSARITNWMGRHLVLYSDPDNPMLDELPGLIKLYKQRQLAEAVGSAYDLYNEITEIYRISLDAARTRGELAATANASSDGDCMSRLRAWRDKLRSVNAQARSSA